MAGEREHRGGADARAGPGCPAEEEAQVHDPAGQGPVAVAARGGAVPGVIMHTDQGGEFTAGLFRAACERLSISQSMGRPGSALDNAVIESWHSTLEFELRRVEHFATRAAAWAAVAAWIEDLQLPPQALIPGHSQPRRETICVCDEPQRAACCCLAW